jgi:DNA repair protein RadD
MLAAKLDGGNQFIKFSDLLEKAFYRWGLTATPFLRDQYSNWLLAGVTGPTLYEKSTKSLIDEGYLTPPKVLIQPVEKVTMRDKSWPNCYDNGIVLNRNRTERIVDWYDAVQQPVFVLCNQVAHAKILHNRLESRRAALLTGSSSSKERRDVLRRLEQGHLTGVVCTTIFDEGIDFPGLRSVILAGGGKSSVKTIQRVGRALRLAEGKTQATIIDFLDESAPALERHSKERIKTYKERGFHVEILD